MIKLSNEDRLMDLIIAGLIETIRVHGPIHNNTNRPARSAAKRILGKIKTELNNTQVKKIKRVRSGDEYIEVESKD